MPPANAPKPAKPAVAAASPVKPAPAPAAATTPAAPAADDSPEPAATEAAAPAEKPAAVKAPSKPAAAATGSYKIQLGAFKSQAEAKSNWTRIHAAHASVLKGSPVIVRADLSNAPSTACALPASPPPPTPRPLAPSSARPARTVSMSGNRFIVMRAAAKHPSEAREATAGSQSSLPGHKLDCRVGRCPPRNDG
ncbi:MAG: hypothetical protein WDN72_00915 [Alphaproteobacteria bacterium]